MDKVSNNEVSLCASYPYKDFEVSQMNSFEQSFVLLVVYVTEIISLMWLSLSHGSGCGKISLFVKPLFTRDSQQ